MRMPALLTCALLAVPGAQPPAASPTAPPAAPPAAAPSRPRAARLGLGAVRTEPRRFPKRKAAALAAGGPALPDVHKPAKAGAGGTDAAGAAAMAGRGARPAVRLPAAPPGGRPRKPAP